MGWFKQHRGSPSIPCSRCGGETWAIGLGKTHLCVKCRTKDDETRDAALKYEQQYRESRR